MLCHVTICTNFKQLLYITANQPVLVQGFAAQVINLEAARTLDVTES